MGIKLGMSMQAYQTKNLYTEIDGYVIMYRIIINNLVYSKKKIKE